MDEMEFTEAESNMNDLVRKLREPFLKTQNLSFFNSRAPRRLLNTNNTKKQLSKKNLLKRYVVVGGVLHVYFLVCLPII
jgi:hypothetical protein